MKYYFACGSNKKDVELLAKLGVTRMLMSYWDLRRSPEVYRQNLDKDLFIDSGAFSAFAQGKTIDIREYATFLKEQTPHTFSNLDVIGSPEKTWVNQMTLESMGLNPLPVFHVTSPLSNLERILENPKYSRFAFGGMVPHSKNKDFLKKKLDAAWNIIIKGKRIPRIHAFGMSSHWLLERYPFASADSTSWIAFRRFGRGINKNLCSRYYLFARESLEWEKRLAPEVHAMQHLEKQVTNLWKSRGITWDEDGEEHLLANGTE